MGAALAALGTTTDSGRTGRRLILAGGIGAFIAGALAAWINYSQSLITTP
ncbi:MAG: hypothetical protein ACRDJ9_28360 [Dehalococcoidia bacterium]